MQTPNAKELEFLEQSLSRRPGVCQNVQEKSELVEKEGNEITENFRTVKVTSGETPSGFSITPRTKAREPEFIEQYLSGRSAVCQNAQEKSELVEKEENSAEFDVSPVAHEITKIVRAENASVSMEEQLDKSGKSKLIGKALEVFEYTKTYGFEPDTMTYTMTNKKFMVMKESGYLPTASTYTDLMLRLFRSNEYKKGCDLYNEMLEKGSYNAGTEESPLDHYVYGSLVHALLRKGRFEQALAKEKQIGSELAIVTYSTMIRGYMDRGKVADAWNVFRHTKMNGLKPDFKTYSMFITCLCKVGRSDDDMQLLTEMRNSGIIPSTINFWTVFWGLNREGKHER
ncbi:hypothetical protein GQ457_02G040940 [Hibiscus cannabinus]